MNGEIAAEVRVKRNRQLARHAFENRHSLVHVTRPCRLARVAAEILVAFELLDLRPSHACDVRELALAALHRAVEVQPTLREIGEERGSEVWLIRAPEDRWIGPAIAARQPAEAEVTRGTDC